MSRFKEFEKYFFRLGFGLLILLVAYFINDGLADVNDQLLVDNPADHLELNFIYYLALIAGFVLTLFGGLGIVVLIVKMVKAEGNA